MKTIITTITILTLSLFAISCSNENSTSEKKYLLEKFVSSSSGLLLKVVYNNKNLPIELQNYDGGILQSVSYFTYLNNKVDRVTYNSGYDKFIYNIDGKLQKRNNYTVASNMMESLNYSYEYFYETKKITIIGRNGLNNNVSKKEYLYNDAGNLIEEKFYTINSANPNGEYQNSYFYSNYDDKVNLFSALPEVLSGGNTSKNNARTISTPNNQSATNYVFEYNEAGYVIKRIELGSTESIQYEYLIK